MGDRTLNMWTVYDDPCDYPGQFVARRVTVRAGAIEVTDDVKVASTLVGLREQIVTETECISWIGRLPNDDPIIVETWL